MDGALAAPSEPSCDVHHEDVKNLTRRIIYNLLTIAGRMNDARNELGRLMGISGPQYSVLMAIARLQEDRGVNVGTVADLLMVSSAFITSECGKLIEMDLVTKRRDPRDRRVVLLSLTLPGRALVEGRTAAIVEADQAYFGSFADDQIRTLATTTNLLVRFCDAALTRIAAADGSLAPLPNRRIDPSPGVGRSATARPGSQATTR